MVHNMSHHFNYRDLGHLRYQGHELDVTHVLNGSATQEVDMKGFNALLCAVAWKQHSIVRYMLDNLRMSVKHNGGHKESAADHTLCLRIAIYNKDLEMLRDLWAHFNAWDIQQLRRIKNDLINHKWY